MFVCAILHRSVTIVKLFVFVTRLEQMIVWLGGQSVEVDLALVMISDLSTRVGANS